MKLKVFGLRLEGAVLVLLVAVLSLTGCGPSGRASAPPEQQSGRFSSAPTIRHVAVERRLVHDVLDLAAKVQPDPTKLVRIYPPTSGRVVSVSVKPGDHVRRGEILAVLQSGDVGTARADFIKAQIEANRANRAMQRIKSLYEHGAAAEKEYIEAQATADSAHAELERATQRLSLFNLPAQGNSDRVGLAAPTDGVVLDISAAPGEFSKSLESSNPILTIADLTTVWVVADLYEKDVAKVRPGSSVIVTLQAYPARSWKGRIASISDALDPVTRTLKIRAVLANPRRELKPEMFGTVRLETGAHSALVVPATAVIREGNKTTVFVDKDGKAEQRSVTLGATVGTEVEVLSGLQAAEQVASEGAELLKIGPQ